MKQKLFWLITVETLLTALIVLTFPYQRVSAAAVPAIQPAKVFSVTVQALAGSATVLPGSTYALTATGFTPKDKLTLTLGAVGLANGTVDDNGQALFSVKIPATLTFAEYAMTVRNQASVSATYAAQLNPSLATSVNRTYRGGVVRIDGLGFTAVETVTFQLNDAANCTTPAHILGASKSTTKGAISVNVTVPLTMTAAATYSVAAIGTTSQVCAVAP